MMLARIVLVCMILFFPVQSPTVTAERGDMPTFDRKLPRLTFSEPASGGILTLVGGQCRVSPPSVSIETQPGEDGSSVSLQLYTASTGDLRFVRATGGILFDGEYILHPGFDGSGSFCFAGTENGLGIPPAPLFLSGEYDGETIRLSWRNPPEGYDRIAVATLGVCIAGLAGDAEHAEIPSDNFLMKDMSDGRPHIYVVGYRDSVPSNAAVVRLSQGKQDDAPNNPFTANTKPNWAAWSFGEGSDGLTLKEDKEAFDVFYITDDSGNRVPIDNLNYFQTIKIRNPNRQGGIYRKFLGLTSGKTYRVQARLSTFRMDDATEEWSYSFHASPGYPDGRDFSPEQFAGEESLPDGSAGPNAGCVVEYRPGHTTGGQWVRVSTGDTELPWMKSSGTDDITLPEGVTEIVLWVRHTGMDTSGVGLDWTKLEDLAVTRVSTFPFPQE